MKKIITLAILLFSVIAFAQAPSKMSYQSVIRNNKGILLSDKKVTIQISILRGSEKGEAVYIETHKSFTNSNGLVTLEIGTGENKTGKFSDVDWANGSYFIKTATDARGGTNFDIVGISELLSVPYALNAKTVENGFSGDFNDLRNKPTKLSEFINDISLIKEGNLPSNVLSKPGDPTPGVPSQVWSLFGNSSTLSTRDKLGTTDYQALVMVTNNIERLRITADGDINLANSLQIGKDLTVKRNVYLNTESGATINNGNFTVANTKATLLTGTLNTNGATDLDATLNVDGVTNLNSALNVNNAAPTQLTGTLDVDQSLNVEGATSLQSNLEVKNAAATHLTGVLKVDGATDLNHTLNVDGITDLNSALNVNNAAPTHLTGLLDVDTTLNVDGATTLQSNLDVNNAAPTHLTGTLDVDQTLNVDGATTLQSNLDVKNGAPTHLTGTLVVDGAFELDNTFLVKTDAAGSGHVAVFENTNNGDGDGIQIKLGKIATKNGGGFDVIDQGLSIFLGQGFGPEKFSSIKALFDGNLDSADGQFLLEMAVPDPDDAIAIASSLCRLTESVTNSIFTELNSSLNLPVVTPALTLPPLCLDLGDVLGNICVPGFSSPTTLIEPLTIIPTLPTFAAGTLNFGCDALGQGFTFPEFSFADQSNALTNENTFIEFTDKTDWRMGAIKAQSIDEWASLYLDPIYLYNLYSTFKGLDASEVIPEIKQLAKETAQSYLDIGVEYSSGNGDYAEWLERVDLTESISAGDIVGVKGGKITKDLTNAEQIMAISHRPIVLGNIPKEGENSKGNNVAFMGQIPVKIMGAVKSGDYIVAKSAVPGYGVAIHQENMSVEDFKLAVGRSWDTNSSSGPKLANTVVGVHNGDFIHILKKLETKYQESEARMSSIEAKVNLLTSASNNAKN